MGDNQKKHLKKEVILISLVILELIVVYTCIVAVKVNTDKKSQNQVLSSNVKTPDPSPNGIVKATASPTSEVEGNTIVEQTIRPTLVPTTTPTAKPTASPAMKPTVKPVATKKPAKTPAAASKPKPSASQEKLDAATKNLYKDCVFIGDSRTEGLQVKTGLSTAKFLTHRGLTVSTAMSEKAIRLENGEKGTIVEALNEGTYKKVFVMFGINELGWPYTSTFRAKYEDLIASIKKAQPDAEIYIQSVIPVTKTKSDSNKVFTLKNVKKFNKVIKAMTKDLGLHYLNVQEAVSENNAYLPEEFSTDGVHLNKTACFQWLDYITDKIS